MRIAPYFTLILMGFTNDFLFTIQSDSVSVLNNIFVLLVHCLFHARIYPFYRVAKLIKTLMFCSGSRRAFFHNHSGDNEKNETFEEFGWKVTEIVEEMLKIF